MRALRILGTLTTRNAFFNICYMHFQWTENIYYRYSYVEWNTATEFVNNIQKVSYNMIRNDVSIIFYNNLLYSFRKNLSQISLSKVVWITDVVLNKFRSESFICSILHAINTACKISRSFIGHLSEILIRKVDKFYAGFTSTIYRIWYIIFTLSRLTHFEIRCCEKKIYIYLKMSTYSSRSVIVHAVRDIDLKTKRYDDYYWPQRTTVIIGGISKKLKIN